MRYFILFLLSIIVTSLRAQLQAGSLQAGSPYSAYGLGDLSWEGRGQQAGLAGTGIGLRSGEVLNLSNPAAYTAIRQPVNMMLETGFHVGTRQMRTTTESAQQREGGFTELVFWLRPHRRWATTLGLQPYSRVSYSVFSDRYLDNLETSYQLINEGEGGLNRLFWGHAYQLHPRLSIGGNVNLLFGSIQRKETFLSPSDLGTFSVTSQETVRGLSVDGGLQWELNVGADRLVLGATVSLENDLLSREKSTLVNGLNTIEDQDRRQSGRYLVPLTYGLGAGYRHANWMLTVEAESEDWSSMPAVEDVDFVASYRGGLAFGITPFRDKYGVGYRPLQLRCGVAYRNSYLNVKGSNFGELLTSFGLGIPVGKARNQLHLSYGYQHRAQTNRNLIEETEHRLTLAFSLRDVWFVKRKYN